MMTRSWVSLTAPLILAGMLTVAGCGASSSGTGGTSPAGGSTAGVGTGGGSTAAAAGGSGSSSDSSCTSGLKTTDPGVVGIFCDGTAKIHVTAGSLTKDFTGGQCHQAGDDWTASAGVVTQQGVYTGKPVDVVAINNQATAGLGTIQLTLSGHVFFDDSATFTLLSGGTGAHLSGTAQSLPSGPDTPVTVDVTC
jgi:hypothetical protein